MGIFVGRSWSGIQFEAWAAERFASRVGFISLQSPLPLKYIPSAHQTIEVERALGWSNILLVQPATDMFVMTLEGTTRLPIYMFGI